MYAELQQACSSTNKCVTSVINVTTNSKLNRINYKYMHYIQPYPIKAMSDIHYNGSYHKVNNVCVCIFGSPFQIMCNFSYYQYFILHYFRKTVPSDIDTYGTVFHPSG